MPKLSEWSPLSEQDQRMLMARLHGCPLKQIAAEYGISADRAQRKLKNALERLFVAEREILARAAAPHGGHPLTIEFLRLSGRTRNCLLYADICDVRQLATLKREQLLEMRDFGAGSLAELVNELDRHGIPHQLGKSERLYTKAEIRAKVEELFAPPDETGEVVE